LPGHGLSSRARLYIRSFDFNPAGCPNASVVEHAEAITPILPVPLEGPVYFVSYGGAAFPDLEIVLQGDNVSIDLVGDTFISKSGITSSTFAHVLDASFSSFELVLPEGPYSALAANGNLCTAKGGLKMPTAFVAQNGAVLDQDAHRDVTGYTKLKLHKQALRAAVGVC